MLQQNFCLKISDISFFLFPSLTKSPGIKSPCFEAPPPLPPNQVWPSADSPCHPSASICLAMVQRQRPILQASVTDFSAKWKEYAKVYFLFFFLVSSSGSFLIILDSLLSSASFRFWETPACQVCVLTEVTNGSGRDLCVR